MICSRTIPARGSAFVGTVFAASWGFAARAAEQLLPETTASGGVESNARIANFIGTDVETLQFGAIALIVVAVLFTVGQRLSGAVDPSSRWGNDRGWDLGGGDGAGDGNGD